MGNLDDYFERSRDVAITASPFLRDAILAADRLTPDDALRDIRVLLELAQLRLREDIAARAAMDNPPCPQADEHRLAGSRQAGVAS